MNQFVGYVSGDLGTVGFRSPAADDGVKVVIGGEYRKEDFDFNPDEGFRSGDGAGQGSSIPPVNGSVEIKEFFAETNIPLVQGRTGFQSLSLDLRYRYSDYDTGITTDTYNLGGEWTPVEAVKLRGGFSRAVRAGNIRELFEPQNLGLWAGVDPCAGPTPELSAAECANTGVTAGQYGLIPLSPAGQYNGVFGGNPDLEPEESDSVTIGIVFTPTDWVPGLAVSIDYWSIEVDGAITTVDPELIVRQCGVTGDSALCGQINRGPNGNLWVGQANVVSTNVNAGFFDTAGIDVAGAYPLQIGSAGSINFNYRATFLDKFDRQEFPGGPVLECAGVWGSTCGRPRPEYKHTFVATWDTPWPLTVSTGWRHVGKVDEFLRNANSYDADAQDYFDLAATYDLEWGLGATTFNVGVTNVLDEDPPVNGRFGNVAVYGNGNTVPGTWDALGRYYFVGLSHQF